MLAGWKTYAGGIGLMLAGLGGILRTDDDIGITAGLGMIAAGLIAVGARAFGQKMLDVLKGVGVK